MLPAYDDITDTLGKPVWYTQHGYPRYSEFTPDQCGVYAQAVALMEVSCQSCEQTFPVALEWDANNRGVIFQAQARRANRVEQRIVTSALFDRVTTYLPDEDVVSVKELRELLAYVPIELVRPVEGNSGSFSLGDPPNHGCVGDTMTSWNLQILQYWERNRNLEKYVNSDKKIDVAAYEAGEGHRLSDWTRYSEHEVFIEEPVERSDEI